jgi:hypothetical protein
MSSKPNHNEVEPETQDLYQQLVEIEKRHKEAQEKSRLDRYVSQGLIKPCPQCGRVGCLCR